MSALPSTLSPAPAPPVAESTTNHTINPEVGEADPILLALREALRAEVAGEAEAFTAGEELRPRDAPVPRWRQPRRLPRALSPPPIKVRRGRRAWEVIVEQPCASDDRQVAVHLGGEDGGRVLLRSRRQR